MIHRQIEYQDDLFNSHLSSKDRLFIFIKRIEFARTSDVIKWGTINFSNRADRDARILAKEGKIERLPEQEKIFRGFHTKEGVWKIKQ